MVYVEEVRHIPLSNDHVNLVCQGNPVMCYYEGAAFRVIMVWPNDYELFLIVTQDKFPNIPRYEQIKSSMEIPAAMTRAIKELYESNQKNYPLTQKKK